MLYRCNNPKCSTDPHGRLIFDFESEEPVCPKCKSDRRKPEFRNRIVKLVTVHYHHADELGPDISHTHGGRYKVACGGSLAGKVATAIPWNVNCKACQESAEWKTAAKENEDHVLESANFPVNVNLESGVIEKVDAS